MRVSSSWRREPSEVINLPINRGIPDLQSGVTLAVFPNLGKNHYSLVHVFSRRKGAVEKERTDVHRVVAIATQVKGATAKWAGEGTPGARTVATTGAAYDSSGSVNSSPCRGWPAVKWSAKSPGTTTLIPTRLWCSLNRRENSSDHSTSPRIRRPKVESFSFPPRMPRIRPRTRSLRSG